MVWFEYFYLKHNYRKKEIILLSVMNRICDISLELDIRIRYSLPLIWLQEVGTR